MGKEFKIVFGNDLQNEKPSRAACLPYTVKNGRLYFLLVVDKKSGDFADYGGGVKKHEFALDACLREFKEESGELFNNIYEKKEEMVDFVAMTRNNMSSIFIPMGCGWDHVVDILDPSNEVSRMVWIEEHHFKSMLANPKSGIWSRIRNFYYPMVDEKNYKQLRRKLIAIHKLKNYENAE